MPYALKTGRKIALETLARTKAEAKNNLCIADELNIKEGLAKIIKVKLVEVK